MFILIWANLYWANVLLSKITWGKSLSANVLGQMSVGKFLLGNCHSTTCSLWGQCCPRCLSRCRERPSGAGEQVRRSGTPEVKQNSEDSETSQAVKAAVQPGTAHEGPGARKKRATVNVIRRKSW